MFDSGCAAVSVLDSRIGRAWIEVMAKKTRTAIDVHADLNGDDDMVDCFVLCTSCAVYEDGRCGSDGNPKYTRLD